MFSEAENIKHINRLFKEVPSMLERVLKNTCAFSVEHESVSSDQCAMKWPKQSVFSRMYFNSSYDKWLANKRKKYFGRQFVFLYFFILINLFVFN